MEDQSALNSKSTSRGQPRNSARPWISLLAVSLIIVIAVGESVIAAEDQQFHMLFEGFQLILVDDLPAKVPIRDLDSLALRNNYPSEQTLVPGRVYAFRKTTGMSDETLGKKVLPERLSKIGARVTKAPRTSKDFVYPYIGGPLFVIQFEKDGHRGTLFNRVHTSSKTGGNWEELILAYQ
jgi:hypothetical protein